MIQSSNPSFTDMFPGPYRVEPNHDGCDATFEIRCSTSDRLILATYYWDLEYEAYRTAIIVAHALNHVHHHKPDALPPKRLTQFVADYPGAYQVTEDTCSYRGVSHTVTCSETNGDVISSVSYHSDIATNEIANHVADALNRLVQKHS